MKTKTPYRLRNWPQYNAALVGRGSLTLWVDEEAIRAWRYRGPKQRGAQYVYTDAALKCVLTLRAVYHLALRATQGLAQAAHCGRRGDGRDCGRRGQRSWSL